MLLIRRTFSRLSVHLSKGISPLIQACDKSEFTEPEDFSSYPKAISELIKYQRTNEAINKLIKTHTKHTGLPVILPDSSYSDLVQYLNISLISRDMQALDSAIHLLWHSFPDKAFPLTSITNTLVATKPLGTEANQKLWRKLVSEMAFYALPNKISPNKVREFFTKYGKYPENFLNLIKYSILTSDHAINTKLQEKMVEINDIMQDYIDFDHEMEKKGMNYQGGMIEKYISKNFMSEEEQTKFRSIMLKVKTKLVKNYWFMNRNDGDIDENQALRQFFFSVDKETIEEIDEFYDKFNSKRNLFEYSELSNKKGKVFSINPSSKKFEESFKEIAQLLKDEYMIEQEYNASEYRMDDLLLECLKYSRPEEEHFEHLEKWLENLIFTQRQIDIPEKFLIIVILNAIRLKRENFMCFLYNNYKQLTSSKYNPLLLAQIVQIIAHSNCQRGYVEAAGKIVTLANNNMSLKEFGLGLFTFESVPNSFLMCYLKDKNFKEAKIFAYEMGLFEYRFDDKLIEQILEVLYGEKDIIGIMMLSTLLLPMPLESKISMYVDKLRNDFEKEGKIYEYYFSSTKHYERPSKYVYNFIKKELGKKQQRLANLERLKKQLTETQNEVEVEEKVVEKELD